MKTAVVLVVLVVLVTAEGGAAASQTQDAKPQAGGRRGKAAAVPPSSLKNEVASDDDDVDDVDGLTWAEQIASEFPKVEVYALTLLHKPHVDKVKPHILQAFNVTAELDHWMANNKLPKLLQFLGDNGLYQDYAFIDYKQPVTYSDYNEGIKFHFFRKYDESDTEGMQVMNLNSLPDMGWDPKLPLKIIIHGFTNTIKSPVIQLIKNAYLRSGEGEYNVVGVDWGRLCRQPFYVSARIHVSYVGARVGEFVDNLIRLQLTQPELVHIIGHSLGAHVAGIAGKSMNSGKANRITGLDPAGPLFLLTKPAGTIYQTDAETVDIIHTNAGYLGKTARLGTVDFYANGGSRQPGCGGIFRSFGSCAHSRSYQLFAYTIEKTGLEATFCKDLPKTARGCDRGHAETTAIMGEQLQFEKEGTYFVKTGSDQPYECF